MKKKLGLHPICKKCLHSDLTCTGRKANYKGSFYCYDPYANPCSQSFTEDAKSALSAIAKDMLEEYDIAKAESGRDRELDYPSIKEQEEISFLEHVIDGDEQALIDFAKKYIMVRAF